MPLRPHGWLFDRKLGGGWIGAFGSHAVDFVRWVFGEVVEAEAFLRTEIDERPDETDTPQPVDVEDGFTAFLVTDRDVTVTIDSSFACAATFAPRMLINGTEGVLECFADARLTLRRDDGSRTDVEVGRAGEKEGGADPHVGPMLRWAELVRDAVRDHRQIEPSFVDGLACDRVLERLRRGCAPRLAEHGARQLMLWPDGTTTARTLGRSWPKSSSSTSATTTSSSWGSHAAACPWRPRSRLSPRAVRCVPGAQARGAGQPRIGHGRHRHRWRASAQRRRR